MANFLRHFFLNKAPKNIFHCSVPRTGNQWLEAIFSDPQILKYGGLNHYTPHSGLSGGVDPRKFNEMSYDSLPSGTIVTGLFLTYECFAHLLKPSDYTVFYVCRDPRDLLVSFYFYLRFSTRAAARSQYTQQLMGLDQESGLRLTLHFMQELGYFTAMRSWKAAAIRDHKICWVRFEDLIGEAQLERFVALFEQIRLPLPKRVLKEILEKYSYQRLSAGRSPGEEQVDSHYRRGVVGAWPEYLSAPVLGDVELVCGELYRDLGY